MESVMNFLAEYYIWFFVAAIVLCFALIGFIIDSKKKQKGEVKNNTLDSTPEMSIPVNNTMDMNNGLENTVTKTESASNMIGNNEPVNMDATMEINDIPINNTPNVVSMENNNNVVNNTSVMEPTKIETPTVTTETQTNAIPVNDERPAVMLDELPEVESLNLNEVPTKPEEKLESFDFSDDKYYVKWMCNILKDIVIISFLLYNYY